ncbi:MAG: hypothetical protein ACLQDF_07095 [Desulfomonilia bacterium]
MNKSNVLRVRDIPKGQSTGLPARATIYKLHSLRKHPRLIYTVPGAGLVFDLDEWQTMCEAAKQSSEERAAQVHRPMVEG